MSNIPELENCPEISFIEYMTLQETEEQLRSNFLRLYREQTGKNVELGDADQINLLIKAFSMAAYQQMQYVEAKGRAEMLNTSTGDALSVLGASHGIERKGPTKATTTVRFTLSAARNEAVAIPAGTRVKTESGKYFDVMDYAEIKKGELYADAMVQAQNAGAESSGLPVGSICILVDPIHYVASVSNLTESTGGLDTEDDASLTRNIYLSPSVYSSAGPKDAYEYWAQAWRSDVADVRVDSPSPCVTNIYFVIEEGGALRLPNETELSAMEAYLSGDSMRPLAEKVVCLAPEEVDYSIAFTYWIAASDQKSVSEIQLKITQEVEAFQNWQRRIGRDVNPTELVARLRQAGAKRVKLTAPEDVTVSKIKLPKCTGATVIYGGLEDD